VTVALPRPAERPTLWFIGVTTGRSSIRTVFPRWARALGLGDVPLIGVDLPLHAPRADYRRVVEFLAADPLSAGALVTTHKIDLYAACADLFAEVDPLARLMGEVSCLAKRDGGLAASAKDPITAGLALDAITPLGTWAAVPADAFVMGAGGSAIAISWYLTRPERGPDRPARIVVTDPDLGRLDALRRVHDELGTDVPVECRRVDGAAGNDALLVGLAPRSLVVNATGLGKDAPGSPVTDRAPFGPSTLAWDFNYRGGHTFLRQAAARGARLMDGWDYFVAGWTGCLTAIAGVPFTTAVLADFAAAAAPFRPQETA
jgi:shikimate 5-dehydrogenase